MDNVIARTSTLTEHLDQDRAGERRAALSVAICGIALIWLVGFAPVAVLHNVAHDTRHSNAFPCH